MAELSCGMKCLKYLLFAFNLVLFLIGIALLVVGIWVLVDGSILFKLLGDTGASGESVDFTKSLLKTSCYVIIAFGAFLFLLAFLGCCGAIKESRCMLGTYAVIVIICLLVEIAAVVLAAVFWQHTKKEIHSYLLGTIHKKYEAGFNGTTISSEADSMTAIWDLVMIKLSCCGVNNSTDFRASPWSWPNNTYNMYNGTRADIPPACCKLKDDGKDDYPEKAVKLDDDNCPTAPTTSNSYGETGCYKKITDLIKKYTVPVIAVTATVAFMEIFVIIAACCLRRRIGQE